MSKATVGFIGLGNMGLPMAARLVAAETPVIGFDASSSARETAELAGITPGAAVVDLARECETVVLMLPSSDVVDVIVDELLRVEGRCMVHIVDMSSSDPNRTKALAQRCEQYGVTLVDAPVSGGVPRARSGDLTLMVGGPEEEVGQLRSLLHVFGRRVFHVGDVGAGHAMKALNNLLSATHLLATNEAVMAAQKFGIAPKDFLDVVNSSSGRSGSSELKLPNYVLPGSFDSGFSAALLEKDVRIAVELEHTLGVPSPVGDAVSARWTELNARLEVGADHTAIIRPVEQELEFEVRSR